MLNNLLRITVVVSWLAATCLDGEPVLADDAKRPANLATGGERDDSTTETSERLRADELVGVASAKARAFSARIQGLEQSLSQSLMNLRANQAVLEESSKRGVRRFGFGPRAQAEQAGDFAGRVYLIEQVAKLDKDVERLTQRFQVMLQEETWKRLTPSDRALIAEHDLIPKSVRESVAAETVTKSDATPLRDRLKRVKSPNDWQIVPLDGSTYVLAFPGEPTVKRDKDSISYRFKENDRTFACTRFIGTKVPTDVPAKQVLDAQAEATVTNFMKDGLPAASRTVQLGGIPAMEVCSYFLMRGNETANFSRIVIIDREFVCVEVLDIDESDEHVAKYFFQSFRNRSEPK